jgi:hypothetical protein
MHIKPIITSACLMAVWLALSGFTVQESASQPQEERKAQDALPKSRDAMWDRLTKCKVHLDKKSYQYSIDYTPEVKAMEGKPVTISGFVMPLESTETFKHFLLSKRTPTCFFCPPGEPNEIVEVFTKKPIKWSDGIVTVTGTFTFTSNPDLGLFFQVKDADSAEFKK